MSLKVKPLNQDYILKTEDKLELRLARVNCTYTSATLKL